MKQDYLNIRQEFESINKLIFIQEYEIANNLLIKLLHNPEAQHNYLINLKTIELNAKLNMLEQLQTFYKDKFKHSKLEYMQKLCFIFIEYFKGNNNIQTMLDKFQNHITIYGESGAAYFGIGECWISIGNTKNAIDNYEKSVAIDPQFSTSYFRLYECYSIINNEEIASKYLEIATNIAPYDSYGNMQTHANLAQEFLNKNMLQEALKAIYILSEWWIDISGKCPLEIQICKALIDIKIYQKINDLSVIENLKSQLDLLFKQLIDANNLYDKWLLVLIDLVIRDQDIDKTLIVYTKLIQMSIHNQPLLKKFLTIY